MATIPDELTRRVTGAVRVDRLIDAAERIMAPHSPTGAAGPALDAAADLLREDGFLVERRAGGHPIAPAVVVRLSSGRPGPTLQFNGHLDTVHLPFVGPHVEDDRLTGTGACDMKGGTAAAIEALRAVRDLGGPPSGSILFTAHDLHEAPWGLGQQLDALIAEGIVGDAVLLPEPMWRVLPVIGRGQACWKLTVHREGGPIHEVLRPPDAPSVIAAGADVVRGVEQLDRRIAAESGPFDQRPSAFIGSIRAGEIYNQYPSECILEGTRRWLPGTDRQGVEGEFRELVSAIGRERGTVMELDWRLVRDAFHLDKEHPVVAAFRLACTADGEQPPPFGPKPFVDDGSSFWIGARVPCITHGPRSGGQHTTSEWADIADLQRVARVFALTAFAYLGAG